MMPPNYSLNPSTKTLVFEQTLDNPPHVEMFLSRNIFLRKVTLFCLRVFLCDSGANMGIYDILLGIFRLLIIIVIIIIINSWQGIYMRLCRKKTAQAFVQPCQRTFCLCKIIPKALFCSKLPGDVKPLYFLSNKLQTIFETLFIIFYSENSSSTTLKT